MTDETPDDARIDYRDYPWLQPDDAMALWQQGLEAWNQWVAENPIYNVSFRRADFTTFDDIDFSGFHFPDGYVHFDQAEFGDGDVTFWRAKFAKGDVSFHIAKFGKGDVRFRATDFGDGDVAFNDIRVGGKFDFCGARLGRGATASIKWSLMVLLILQNTMSRSGNSITPNNAPTGLVIFI